MRSSIWCALILLGFAGKVLAQPPSLPSAADSGAVVAYQLPATGPLPQTYRVTLAIVDATNSDFIISEFASGVVRTVTAENQGKFTETWNGLDDNFMPVPPGTYGVKGIYMPARPWVVDGQYHTITPKFAGGASSWLPAVEDWKTPLPFDGDPCDAPMSAIAVGPNGHAVFYYRYLENTLNNPFFDLNKPAGIGQFITSYYSGGAGGGEATATDGNIIWSQVHEGGPQFIYRPDGKPFGAGMAHRNRVYIPDGQVTGMAAYHDAPADRSFLCVAQRGRMNCTNLDHATESTTEFADKVTFHDGENGTVLAEMPLYRPQGLAIQNGTLYALHPKPAGGWEVASVTLAAGRPQGDWQPVFTVPAPIRPFDIAVDGHGDYFLSDPKANHVYRLSATGEILGRLGAGDRQQPGSYDPDTMMAPGKLAAWTDAAGRDRLLVVEDAGPNRVGEWSPDGKLIRQFLNYQTKANDGYAVDPEHPNELYISGQQDWIVRFQVDYTARTWTVDAVWPDDPVPKNGFDTGWGSGAARLDHPKLVRVAGREYLACARNYAIYRHDGDRWVLSAAVMRHRTPDGSAHFYDFFIWHDANGNGRVDPDEITPLEPPGKAVVFRYHGEQFLDDLSLVATAEWDHSVYRLAPAGFDAYGNPVFKKWEKLLTDPFMEARLRGTADALHGGNELADVFSDWSETTGSMTDGFYVVARGGKNFSANFAAQDKISRYVPDGHGGYQLKWRTGREAFGLAQPGEVEAAIHLHQPINGLLGIIDQMRCGVLLYTTDGLYVDTLFPDSRAFSARQAGVYSLPGEFFAGDLMANRDNGKIYVLAGKATPMLYEAEGWSTTENPVQSLDSVQKTVTIGSGQIAAPPEIALSVRGGAGTARVARFSPAAGGAILDGSLSGWVDCAPVIFNADQNHTVSVRCLYDPDHIYLRWQVRLGSRFDPRPLAPLERIFTHDRLADTLSFYIQGDPNARAGSGEGHPGNGRPGDVRFVFGIFKDGRQLKPAILGMYPTWPGADRIPQTYGTAAGGNVTYARAGPVPGAELHYVLDEDNRGFVLTAAIPRSAIPGLPPFGSGLRTMVDFQATLGGHDTFWWANTDGSASRETYDEPTEARLYPGAWAPVQFQGLNDGVVVQHWLVCGPFGGPGAEAFDTDPAVNGGYALPVRKFFDGTTFPPERGPVDPKMVFAGEAIRGYWPDPKAEHWRPVKVADLDNRVEFGDGAQMWYAASWIHVPADTSLEFRFQGQVQAYLTYSLNGETVQQGEILGNPMPHSAARMTARTLTLRCGWNEIRLKGYCIGYNPFRAGLVLAGPPDKLWTLRLSDTPPAAGQP